MTAFSQIGAQQLMIGAAATKTTGAISAMNDGEIGIFTPSGVRVTEATAATIKEFIIVKKTASGGIPLVSSPIKKANIKSAARKVYVTSTEQLSFIGYNSTLNTGSFDVINDNDYHIRISLRSGRTSNHGGLYMKHGFYTSDTSATQAEVSLNLFQALVAEFSKEPDRVIQFSRINSAASTGTLAETYSPVYGSKYVNASAASTVTAGDYVRFGTTDADPIYKVITVSGTVITLDTPYQGTTAVAVATDYITVATADAASFGIKMQGLALPYVTGKLAQDLQVNIFDVTLENFGSTLYTIQTAATPGNGTEKQVKELEFFCQGNEGDYFRMGEPNLFPSRHEATGNYDLIHIVAENQRNDSIVSGATRQHYTLAIPQTAPNYAIAATADDITDVLEVLSFGSTTGALAVT